MSPERSEVRIDISAGPLRGDLSVPAGCRALVVFAHGSGSSRHSPRNAFVADVLNAAGFATLLFDLLTADEDVFDRNTGELRFDVELLAGRLVKAVDWAQHRLELPLGLFGASTGAAAALIAAARRPSVVQAVVSRGGRPDLAGEALARVRAPTLLIVGGHDEGVIQVNRRASLHMRAPFQLEIVPGASHLFEEPGALDATATLAAHWFSIYLFERPTESAHAF